MAADSQELQGKRKRKRPEINRRKLISDEKVEVRSLEDGFLGSWHTGAVICCQELSRVVVYDHLLSDGGCASLVEQVEVTPEIEGIASNGTGKPGDHRGVIRPFPPKGDPPAPWSLHYGECVDMLHEDAWWEGVIIDHEDGREKRRVFFPDMGDEMEAQIDKLRLTQDWDEAADKWKCRGNWLFLELIEELEQDWLLPVSFKQIWYEVRVKNGFEKLKEWTCSLRSAWRELVYQVLSDNYKITIKHFFKELNFCGEFSESVLDAVLKTQGLVPTSSLAVVPAPHSDNKEILPHGSLEQEDNSTTNEQAVLDLPILSQTTPDQDSGIGSKSTRRNKLQWQPAVPHLVPGAEFCPDSLTKFGNLYKLKKRAPAEVTLNARKHLLHLGWTVEYAVDKLATRVRYFSPDGDLFYSLIQACQKLSTKKGLVRSMKMKVKKARNLQKRKNLNKICHSEGSIWLKRGRKTRASMRHNADSSTPCRKPREVVAASSRRTPRTILSWLIDNNVVLPRAKVQFRCRKDGRPMAEGRITREGIKCSCCREVYSLSRFKAHAGSSTNVRPWANIFLEDGRCLLDCLSQFTKPKSIINGQSKKKKTETGSQCNNKTNDSVCSVCQYGGELVLCDQCPSSFHTQCLGLEEVPDGDWFCPSCSCGICSGQCGFNRTSERFIDSSVVTCGQCEHQYHVGCLKKKGILDCHPEGHWFCQESCEQIYRGLRNILGKPIPLGKENLTWTLVKYDSRDYDTSDNELLIMVEENYSKLNVALSAMHECFEPVKVPDTGRDLVEDVIFSRWSELKRLNFQGFYTVVLEKNDEVVSAVTVRIYGKKVAEIPLVATRQKYRRLGMCRILMNALEQKLMELGVERLVLPSVQALLHTWTTSFGFSVMNESERLRFLDYTFLDFPDTVFCQKLLTHNPSQE